MAVFQLWVYLVITAWVVPSLNAQRRVCPVIEEVPPECPPDADNLCERDAECVGGQRCCTDGCSLACVTPVKPTGCPVPIDLGLIVDSSGSISRTNWLKTKEFLKSVANAFEISEKGTHVSVLVYASNAEMAIKFNEFQGAHQNSANLARAMDKLKHLRGLTFIDKALKRAKDSMFTEASGMRKGVQKVALVITDGKQTVDKGPFVPLGRASQPLKNADVVIYSLGVGTDVDIGELFQIATSENTVFKVDSFEQLDEVVKNITKGQCKACSNAIDLIFGVPTSTSISSRDFKEMKDFLKASISFLEVGGRKAHVSFVPYSDTAEQTLKLDQLYSREELENFIDNSIQQSGRGLNVEDALNRAADNGFTIFGGTRPSVPKVMILLAPQSTSPEDAVRKAAFKLKSTGAKLITVGIGNDVDRDLLNTISSQPKRKYNYHAADMVGVNTHTNNIVDTACKSRYPKCPRLETIQPDCPVVEDDECSVDGDCSNVGESCCQSPGSCKRTCGANKLNCLITMDVGIVMDTSEVVSSRDFAAMKEFAKTIIYELADTENDIKIGLMQYGENARTIRDFNGIQSAADLAEAIDTMQKGNDAQRRVDRALRAARRDLFSLKGGMRQGHPRQLIMVTASASSPGSESIEIAAKGLDDVGVNRFAVGINNDVNVRFLTSLATDNRYVFRANRPEQLKGLASTLQRMMCQAKPGKCAPPTARVDPGACLFFPSDMIPCGKGKNENAGSVILPITKEDDYFCPGESKCCLTNDACFLACRYPPRACQGKLDLTLVLDSSDSAGSAGFQKVKRFAKEFIDGFDVKPDGAHVAMVTFGSSSGVDFRLNSFTDKQRIKDRIDALTFRGGRGQLTAALDAAANDVYTTANGMRDQAVNRSLVIIHDGRFQDAEAAVRAASALKTKLVDVFDVAVGTNPDVDTIKRVVSREPFDNAFMTSSYNALDPNKRRLTQRVCEGALKMVEVVGPPGPPGAKGDNGRQGQTGNRGIYGSPGEPGGPGGKGVPGVRGPTGRAGPAGRPGEIGVLVSVPGAKGPLIMPEITYGAKPATRGPPGERGRAGPRGMDGMHGYPGSTGPSGDRGAPGPPGSMGPRGPPGRSGPDGEQGQPGRQGPMGDPGQKGPVGDSGTPGINGPKGDPGWRGIKGNKGPRGELGDDGVQGMQGPLGKDGRQGAPGAPGLSGRTGTTGQPGAAGPAGPAGNAGLQGASGAAGSPGAPGLSGPKGAPGNSGVAGNNGYSGESGDAGRTGSKGVAGANGYLGATGATGPKGSAGSQGPAGPQGKQGDQGNDGARGNQGGPGSQGESGDVGKTGARGETGAKGKLGNNGQQGPQGVPGSRGRRGSVGATGPAGLRGPEGDRGAEGHQGATGPDGLNGAKGNTGESGRRGQQGNKGETGAQGNTGATGPIGETGNRGKVGGIGKPGDNGSPGAGGDDGITGETGPMGLSGKSGVRGFPGSKGARGAVGKPGDRGVAGPSGPKGEQGAVGSSGLPGPPGQLGAGGSRGETGADGKTGPAGVSGPSGSPGNQGPIGVQGAKGTAGTAGESGSRGPDGVGGELGETGAPGGPGRQGEQGSAGAHGERGINGAQGEVGPAGPTGPIGAPGANGGQGKPGPSGDTGDQGRRGGQGRSGGDGARGADGESGPAGETGEKGAKGEYGDAGSAGANGARGPQGERGVGGPAGADGYPGATGAAGPVGGRGARGATGAKGVQGERGLVGLLGETGPMGAQGSIGVKGGRGDYGADGVTGAPGETGPQGSVGSDGPIGNPGPSGPTGLQGKKGDPGDSGTPGSRGEPGKPGLPGRDGSPGASGDGGVAGPAGARGGPGLTGPGGMRGGVGAPGPAGTNGGAGGKGERGNAGKNGNKGAAGKRGGVGVSGVKGNRGESGVDGYPGAAGAPGYAGRAGGKGTSGSRGADGSPGLVGLVGVAGPQGAKGSSGVDGATGADGEQGSVGVTGKVGVQGGAGEIGDKGFTGGQGQKGDRGVVGEVGPAGAIGRKGAAAFIGKAGPQGPKGIRGGVGESGHPGGVGKKGPEGPAGVVGLIGGKGDRGPRGQDGPRGAPGPPGPPGRTAGATMSQLPDSGIARSSKNPNLYRSVLGANEDIEISRESDVLTALVTLSNQVHFHKSPVGTKKFPARTCRDLGMCYGPSLENGKYWIDPNEGIPDDAVEVFCNFKTNSTCIFPSSNATEKRKWYSGPDGYQWIGQDLKGLGQIRYVSDSTQLTFLRLLSDRAKQTITYHCKNSVAWYNEESKDYEHSIKLMGDNGIELHASSSNKFKPRIVRDDCWVKDGTWRRTVVEVDTHKTHRLPVNDIAVYDIGDKEEEFGLEIGPVCFS